MMNKIPRRRIFLSSFMILVILGLSLFKISDHKKSYYEKTKLSEKFHLTLLKSDINSELQRVASDLNILSYGLETKNYIENSSTNNANILAEEFLNYLLIDTLYYQIRFIDNTGKEVARVNYNNGSPSIIKKSKLLNQADKRYIKEISKLKEKQIYFSDIYFNAKINKDSFNPILKVAKAVYDKNHNRKGVIILEYSPLKIFRTFFENMHTEIKGNLLLVDNKGNYLEGLERKGGITLLFDDSKTNNFSNDYPNAWSIISTNKEGFLSSDSGLITYTTVQFNDLKIMGNANKSVSSSNKPFLKLITLRKPHAILKSLNHFSLLLILDAVLIAFILTVLIMYQKHQNRKAAQDAKIKEAEVKYKGLVENSVAGIYIVQDHVIKFVNKRTAEIFGFESPEQMIGLNTRKFAVKDAWKVIEKNLEYLVKNKKDVSTIEVQNFKKDGSIIDVKLIEKIIPYNGSMAVQGTLIDISDRKKTERLLKESESKYRQLFENNLAGVFESTIDGEILNCNATFAKMYGYNSPDQLIGKSAKVLYTNEKIRNEIIDELNSAPYSLSKEYQMRKKDNSLFWVLENFIISANGNIFGTSFDITQQKKDEALLKESEEKYRNLVESSSFGIVVHTNGVVNYANSAAKKIMEADKTENVVGKNIMDFVHPEFREQVLQRVAQTQNDGIVSKAIEEKFITFKGTAIDVEVVSIPFFYDGKRSSQVSFNDITNRKKAETDLIAKENYIQSIFSNIHEDIFIMNRDFEITNVNRNVLLESGYTKEEAIGKHCYEISHQNNKPCDLFGETCYLSKVFETGISYNYKHVHYNSDGTEKHVNITMSPLKDNDGNVIEVIEAMRDMSELVEAERELKQSEVKYKLVVETAPEGIITLNKTGEIISWNNSATKIFGYEKDEIIGKNFTLLIPEEFKKKHKERIKREMLSRDTSITNEKPTEVLSLHKNGYIFNSEISLSVGETEKDKFITILVRDITVRKEQEAELEKHRNHLEILVEERTNEITRINHQLENEIIKVKEAEHGLSAALEKEKELSEVKTKFISTVSHEFRTPLTTIYSSMEILEMYKDITQENVLKHSSKIKSSVNRLNEMLEDILLLNRTERGVIPFSPSPVKINSFCESITGELSVMLAKDQEIKTTFDIHKSIYEIDKNILQTILVNLLTNSIKYSPNHKDIELVVSDSVNRLNFEIKDRGMGISKEDLAQIFNPFFRSDDVLTLQGTGLGLSIVKQYTDIHKGTVTVSSKLGEGTSFKVSIPV